MDWPQFFRTAVNQLTISTARWRGIALLCKSPPIFQSPRGTATEDQVMPARGLVFSDRDVSLLTTIKPTKAVISDAIVSTGITILAAKPGVRYYVHSVSLSSRLINTDTTTSISVSGTIDGTSTILAYLSTVPSAAGAGSIAIMLDVLLDTNTAITATAGTATPTTGRCTLTYMEVGAS